MKSSPLLLPCDGCGLPASPEHIAARVHRLELSTRYRPVHVSILFVEAAPAELEPDDFYAAPEKSPLLKALGIISTGNQPGEKDDPAALLNEFQRRGFHLVYLSECPRPAGNVPGAEEVLRLAPTLVRRVRFNYKPRLVAPLGVELFPLVEALQKAGIGPVITTAAGQPLPVPRAGVPGWPELFQQAVSSAAPRDYLAAGYDRLSVTPSDRDFGAGGNS